MADISPGTLLYHRYRIEQVIASGGMGSIYEAFDEQLERIVAVKQNGEILSADLFLHEAKLLARLRHPHLPAAIDVFEENNQQFLVMEFIEGTNLDQLLTERKKFSVNEVTPWVLQILDALDYLHTREPPIIHRDIKPSNLVLSYDTIFLVDFGISKDAKQTHVSGSGTRQYASPEHTMGSTSVESDLYSLSATLYHLLTGRPAPSADVRLQEVRRKGRSDPLVPAHVSEPAIDQAVSDILSKGLNLEPDDRFGSAAEMRDAFQRAVATVARLEPPAETGPGPFQTLLGQTRPRLEQWRSTRPTWIWWGVLGVLAALLICALAVGLFRRSFPPPLTPSPTEPSLAGGLGDAIATSTPFPTLAPSSTTAPSSPVSGGPTTVVATQPPLLPTTPSQVSPTEAAIAPPPTPPAAAPNTIRIALQSPISGEWSAIGTSIRNGAELAVKQRNKPLTDLGFNVEFVPFDDQSNPEQGRVNAQAIVADPASLCVVGHFNSGVTLAAQPIYEAANLVQISPGSTNPQVTDGTNNVWRVVGRDDVQGTVAAQFAREVLHSQRAFVIHDNTTYGRKIAEVFRQDATANGPSVGDFTFFEDTEPEIDFGPFVDKIQQLNPDVIFFAGSYTRGSAFFKLARERGIAAQFLGSDSLDNPALAEAGAAVDGMHFTTVAAPVSAFPQAGQFAQDYKAAYGQDAPPFSPESYDAATICMEAVARAARTTGRIPTREEVLNTMRALFKDAPFRGISGNYRFNDNGDPQSVGYYVVQVNAQNWGANKVVKTLLGRPPG